VHGQADGPVPFHYPGVPLADDFGLGQDAANGGGR
jgi:phospholipid/cholesterol/gamma-HCH transport system ATP-binding protein